ncbi:MAG: SGNH/GDSL hydrolase family protein [Planctomycetaceae bacterium]|nr:SGNH/GDSL hydrolase family protein [Planctomycetaceae bacterium]
MPSRLCQRTTFIVTAFSLAASLFLSTPISAQEVPPPLSGIELADGDSIVFLGDSITHQCLYTQYVEDFLYTRFPHLRLKVHNAGVGGAKAWDALQRFDKDVAAYQPKYVTVLLGMNDGSYRPYDEQVFQTYRQDMTTLVGKITETGATPILMTPTMFDARAKRLYNQNRPGDPETNALYNSVLAFYGTWCREVAVEQGHGFVDMWSPLNNLTLEQRKTDPSFTMIRDAVHPGPDGQLVMAVAIVTDMQLPRQVSTLRLSKTPKGQWTARATGGEAGEVTEDDGVLSFEFKSNALPWVVPEDAALGAKLTKLGHRLSREAVEVHGFAPGQYELEIDGTVVGKYSAEALERHIELQENAKTPQHQQAMKVAMLNKERNEGPVRSLRGEWSRFQQYARVRRQVEENPDNQGFKDQLAKLEEAIMGMDDRVAEHNAAAKQIEDRIFEANQPQTRKYVLRRVK